MGRVEEWVDRSLEDASVAGPNRGREYWGVSLRFDQEKGLGKLVTAAALVD